jgi:predicted cupin superfamily sugar epimerase
MRPTDLLSHPEGGRFKEVFRSPVVVKHRDGTTKSAIKNIYYSLKEGEVSKFHRLTSDEVWNLYQGHGVHLYQWDGSQGSPRCITLSAEQGTFCHVVPAGCWQARSYGW